MLGDILHDERVAQVGLVGAVFLHRVGISDARPGRGRYRLAIAEFAEDAADDGLHGVQNIFLLDEAHFEIDGDATRYGQEVTISPSSIIPLVVKIAPIAPTLGPLGKPTLRVGEQVIGGRTQLGAVIDVTSASQPVLAHYVSDAGNGASIRVEPATAPAMP